MPDIKPPPMTRRSLLVGASATPLTPFFGPHAPDPAGVFNDVYCS